MKGGLFVGKGFRWHGGHTQILESALAQDGPLPVDEGPRGGIPALYAIGQDEEVDVVIPWSELEAQTGLQGSNRSGKTTELELMSVQAIHAPGASVMIDPKGHRDWLIRCAVEAYKAGKRFILITPVFPHLSAKINVLGTAERKQEVAMRIQALMPVSRDPFFTQYALALIEQIAGAQQALGIPWTLEEISRVSTIPQHMHALISRYLTHLGYPLVPQGKKAGSLNQQIHDYKSAGVSDTIADDLITFKEWPAENYRKITGTLIPTFRGIVGPPYGHLFSAHPPEVTWDQIFQQECVVYISLASMLLGEDANRIARVILQDLSGYLGQRYAYEDVTHATPVTVLVDEFGNVGYPLFTDALNKGGQARARFILAMQSLADITSSMGKEEAQRVLDNLNNKFWFRLAAVDPQTAEQVTDAVTLVRLPERGVGLGFGGEGGLTGNTTLRTPGQRVSLFRDEWIKGLPRGICLARIKGELWLIRVPLLAPVPKPMLEQLGLLQLWTTFAQRQKEIPQYATDDRPLYLVSGPGAESGELPVDGDEDSPS
jgi:hypothetical protein